MQLKWTTALHNNNNGERVTKVRMAKSKYAGRIQFHLQSVVVILAQVSQVSLASGSVPGAR